jgi:hypothetical protein
MPKSARQGTGFHGAFPGLTHTLSPIVWAQREPTLQLTKALHALQCLLLGWSWGMSQAGTSGLNIHQLPVTLTGMGKCEQKLKRTPKTAESSSGHISILLPFHT